jgi:hypothetical protein
MLDRAFRLVLRDLSTYFLIVATVAVPLHVVHGFVFQRVVAVSELHEEIEHFPEDVKVRKVGPSELSLFRATGWGVAALEVLFIPLLVGAARRVLSARAEQRLPTVPDAWSHALSGTRGALASLRRPGLWGPALLVALVLGLLAEQAGLLAIEPLSDGTTWAGDAVVRAAARSLAAPFLIIPLALRDFF